MESLNIISQSDSIIGRPDTTATEFLNPIQWNMPFEIVDGIEIVGGAPAGAFALDADTNLGVSFYLRPAEEVSSINQVTNIGFPAGASFLYQILMDGTTGKIFNFVTLNETEKLSSKKLVYLGEERYLLCFDFIKDNISKAAAKIFNAKNNKIECAFTFFNDSNVQACTSVLSDNDQLKHMVSGSVKKNGNAERFVVSLHNNCSIEYKTKE